MYFVNALGRCESQGMFGAKPIVGTEKITPRIHAGPLGVVKTVLGNILIGDIDQTACVKVRLGLEIRFGLACFVGPLPFEFGRDLVVIDHFQGLGLNRSHEEKKPDQETGFE